MKKKENHWIWWKTTNAGREMWLDYRQDDVNTSEGQSEHMMTAGYRGRKEARGGTNKIMHLLEKRKALTGYEAERRKLR